MKKSLPTRTLREHPDLKQLKRQARQLLDAFRSGDAAVAAEVDAHYRDANPSTFALHDAQLVIARSYGFESWPKLKAYVEGITLRRFAEAVRANDIAAARGMLKRRPELGHASLDNQQVLHFAVLNRSPEMVRLLMEHGANAREGVYPHREATTPLAIARDRGYTEIVANIEAAERQRRETKNGRTGALAPDELLQAIVSGHEERARAMMAANPALIQSCNAEGWTPMHAAARVLNARLVEWLLKRGVDASKSGPHGHTPLDLAAGQWWGEDIPGRFAKTAALLRNAGAAMTPRAAVALGEMEWLQARHAEGNLTNEIEDTGGLLRIAVTHNRPDILDLLLEFGFDPDERKRFGDGDELVFTWGMPLWHCAGSGRYEMAEQLLTHGADANAAVYASGDPVFQAYSQQDWRMVELLERHGGVPSATTAGLYRQTELARKMLAGEAKFRSDAAGGETVAEQLLWGAACGGDPEIVRIALERVDWPRDDIRWFNLLEQPLRVWTHGSSGAAWDRSTYLTCFRLLLERCDPNLRGRMQDRGQFGLTLLHSIAGSREHVTPEERVAFAMMVLDAGGHLNLRDNLLQSTPLGWACRWGRIELVRLFLERGADPVEAEAEPWATPPAWAQKMGHSSVLQLLSSYSSTRRDSGISNVTL